MAAFLGISMDMVRDPSWEGEFSGSQQHESRETFRTPAELYDDLQQQVASGATCNDAWVSNKITLLKVEGLARAIRARGESCQNFDEQKVLEGLKKMSFQGKKLQPLCKYKLNGPQDVLCEAILVMYPNEPPGNSFEAANLLHVTIATVGVVGVVGYVKLCVSGGPWGIAVGIGIPVTAGGISGMYLYNRIQFPLELRNFKNETFKAVESRPALIYGRDEIILKIFRCWSESQKDQRKHPLLVGKSGVGKTSIIREIARRIAFGQVPSTYRSLLQGKTLFLGNAAAFSQSGGMHQAPIDEIKGLMKRIKKAKDNVIIAFDEIHAIFQDRTVGEAAKSCFDNDSDAFKYTVSATTQQEYKDCLKKQGYARRFQKIKVDFLQKSDVLISLKQTLFRENIKLDVSEDLLEYIYDSSLPLCSEFSSCVQPDISHMVLSRAGSLFEEKKGALLSFDEMMKHDAFEDKIRELRRLIAEYSEAAEQSTDPKQKDELNAKILFIEYFELKEVCKKKRNFETSHDLLTIDRALVDRIISEKRADERRDDDEQSDS